MSDGLIFWVAFLLGMATGWLIAIITVAIYVWTITRKTR